MTILHTPYFLTVEEVLEIHATQLATHGGREGLRNRGALESAVAMPQTAAMLDGYLHAEPYEIVAAYVVAIAKAKAFVDGNKRTAINEALAFIGLNDLPLRYPWWRLYDALMASEHHTLDKTRLAAILRDV